MFDIFQYSQQNLLMIGVYNPWLVGLSVLVAIFSAFCAFYFATQTRYRASCGFARRLTLFSGSVALGCGIWAMHFIGMLAFNLCTQVDYEPGTTLISMLPSVLASWVVLGILTERRLSRTRLLQGGVLMGAGIGAMHYTGMAAMDMAPVLKYDPLYFALSILVAVALATLALWFRFGLIHYTGKQISHLKLNLISSVVLGCAIAGMHYMGMVAARFVQPAGGVLLDPGVSPSATLAVSIAAITVVITLMILGGNLLLMYQEISSRSQRNEKRLHTIMDTALDGIVSINGQGLITSANKAVEKLLGWEVNDLLGRNVDVLVPQPYRSEHDGYISRYLQTGEAKIIGTGRRVQAQHKDGSLVPIHLGIGHSVLNGEDLFVAFISDIRQQVKMEQDLQENEAKFRSLIGNIPGAGYRCLNTDTWPMIYISDAVRDITGYAPEAFMLPDPQISLADLIDDDHIDHLQIPSEDRTGFHFEYRITTRSGEKRWLLDSGIYVEDKHNPGQGWLDGFIMDITEHKQLVAELEASKAEAEASVAAKSAFLANMSHEIRTPMNAIIGFSDVLMREGLSFTQQRHVLTINSSAKSLLHLLNDILDSAKLEKGKLQLEYSDFSLSEQVDIVISTLWVQARKQQLGLDISMDPKLQEYYYGAPERIRQVLMNLVGNAIKFTETGKVRVSTELVNEGGEKQPSEVAFVVTDTGIGIPADHLDSIFEPFTQADASMSRRFGGTGLGTTISKQLVELMGGRIGITSEPGKGTEVRFVLPLQPGEAVAAINEQAAAELPPLHVLVADDIAQNRELLRLMLERDGHEVVLVPDGAEAVQALAVGRFDVILMDVQMPTMDGLEATRKIRKLEKTEQREPVPIVALTASVLEEDRLASQAAGMDGFASKPVDYPQLTREIARVTGHLPAEAEAEAAAAGLALTAEPSQLLNMEKGVLLWGSESAYLQEVARFLEGQGVQADMEMLLDDMPLLAAKAHALKGVSGNLAMPALMKNYARLEVAAQQEQPAECQRILDQLSELRAVALNELQQHQQIVAEQVENAGCISFAQMLPMVDQLIEAAQHGELDDALLTQLYVGCDASVSQQVGAIKNAFDDFDFEGALAHLKSLHASLSAEL